MRIIQQDRGTGKTEQMIEWLIAGQPLSEHLPHTHNRLLVVSDAKRRDYVRDWLRRYFGIGSGGGLVDFSPRQYRYFVLERAIVLPHEMLRRGADSRIEVGIDELDDVLYALLHRDVALATLTPEEGP